MRSIISQLEKISKTFIKKYDGKLIDIILFGSLIRGKSVPKDIDILLIFNKKVDKNIEYELKKIVSGSIKDASLISKTEESYKETSFDAREGVLFEGYSLINSRFISSDFGFASFGLFLYDTSKMSNTDKTRFYYALNGRASEGFIKMIGGMRLSNNILAAPLGSIEPAKEFFDHWKIDYRYVPSLIPQRLGKASIIGKVR